MMKFYAQYRRCRNSNPCFYDTTQSYRCIITENPAEVNHFFYEFREKYADSARNLPQPSRLYAAPTILPLRAGKNLFFVYKMETSA